MNESALLRLLKEEQAKFSIEALRRPSNGSEFEYGYRCGLVAGLEVAMNKIIESVKEEENE